MPKNKKIAILGPVGISIPPEKQGGIEWVVYHLTKGLTKKGHKVLLFAPSNAKTAAQLIPVTKVPVHNYKVPDKSEISRKLRVELSMLSNMRTEVLKHKNEIGLVFNHTVNGGIFADLEQTMGVPVYHITHLPIYNELAEVYKKNKSRLLTISDSQRKPFPKLRYSATIYNGIEPEKFPFSNKPKNYFIFAGKIIPSKNPLGAIQAAKKAHTKLLLAGKISDKAYFKKLEPHFNKNIKYLGEVPFKKLLKLYSQAKALLMPIEWEEPFGLVMVEAMATGTPVIAFNRGSVSEIVRNNENGFIVNNVKEMVKAMAKIDQINRKNCREYVFDNFSIDKMVDDYEKLYLKTIKK